MISAHWLDKRRSHWTRLERLLDQGRAQGLKSLPRPQLQELGLLYRQAAADLSTLREDPSGKYYAHSLNLLLAQAHNIIYAGQKSSGRGLVYFFRYTYPRIFRRNLPLIALALLLFVAGGLAGMLVSLTHPDFMRVFLGEGMMNTIERHEMWTHSIVSVKPYASSRIMTNNLSVSLAAVAVGITAGLGTFYMMVFNGVLLGVVGSACWLNGMSLDLWSFVAPHCVLELPAIFIAGAAGFRVAQGLLFPGVLPRRDSLIIESREALQLFLATIPMLVVAGLLEAFVSPTGLAPGWKFAVAVAVATIFYGHLFFASRGNDSTVVEETFV